MTEYTVKDIGHQRIVYADRQSIGACGDEDSALKLIAEHKRRQLRNTQNQTNEDHTSGVELSDPQTPLLEQG